MGNINIFQAGSLFPSISGSALCLSNGNEIEKVEREHFKKQIINILNEKERVNISSLSEELQIPPRKVVSALKDLEEEGLIKETK